MTDVTANAPLVGQDVASGYVATIVPGEHPVVEAGGPSEEDMAMWMSLRPHDLDEFLMRPVQIASGQLLSTDTLLTSLQNWFPTDLLIANAAVLNKMKNFDAFRGTIEVTFVLNAPTNAYGLYLLAAVPNVISNVPFNGESGSATSKWYECDSATFDSPYNATQGIHGFIDVSTSNTVKLTLPYLGVEDARSFSYACGDAWRLTLWCLSPVANSVNAVVLSADYKLYANFTPDLELTISCVQGKDKASGVDFAKHAKTAMDVADKWKKEKTISSGAKKVAGLAAAAGMAFPVIAPLAASVAAGAAAVTSLADYFGFTRESKPDMPTPMRLLSMGNRNCVDGFDGSEINALFQTNAVSIDPTIGGGPSEDECTIGSLYSRWTIIDNFSWATTDASGTILRKLGVTPHACAVVLGVRYPTTAGYIGMPFKYWRGGMEYRVMISSSSFHRGQLQVLWDNAPPAGTTYALEPTGMLHNTIMEATGSTAADISVPYSQTFQCMRNTGMGDASAAVWSPYNFRNCNGFLVIRVLNALQATVGTSTIKVVVLARACPDMRFGVPVDSYQFQTSVSTAKEFNMAFQIQGDEPRSIGDGVDIVAAKVSLMEGETTEAYPSDQVMWGENVLSARALAQRFSRIGVMGGDASTANPNTFVFPFYYPRPLDLYKGGVGPWTITEFNQSNQNAMGNAVAWTWFSHVASMFCGVRGSVRVKVQPAQTANGIMTLVSMKALLDTEVTVGTTNASTNWANTSVTMGNSNVLNTGMDGLDLVTLVGGGVEVCLPNYAESKFWVYRFEGVLGKCYRQNQVVIMTGVAQSTIQRQEVVYAAGPDISFIRFRRVPGLIAR